MDSLESSAKDSLLPKRLKLRLTAGAFSGKSGSYATGPGSKLCHATMEAVELVLGIKESPVSQIGGVVFGLFL